MKIKTLIPLCAAAMILAACGGNDPTKGDHTYNTFTSVSPSNWNELTYQDNNDTQILSYLSGSFFTYDFEFDANGKIVDGKFKTCFDGAKAIADVTTTYAGSEKWAVPSDATKGYAYKITLRDDLKWDDGTEIHAKDFVYSMKQQLDPLFQNYRADSFYNGSTVIHNAMNYVKQGQTTWLKSTSAFAGYSDDIADQLVFRMGPSSECECYIRADWGEFPSSYTLEMTWQYFITNYGLENPLEDLVALENKTIAEIKADEKMNSTLNDLIDFWEEGEDGILAYCVSEMTFPSLEFSEVGIFVGATENELVVVLDKPLVLLDDNGGMTYKCAYNFASLPLVKESLYESCKKEPEVEGGLWTTNYNTSVETSASWGPYRLAEFQAGKAYTLVRNEHWYGYKMDEYKGQYQTDKIECETLANQETIWLKFKAGDLASVGVSQSYNNTEYKNSSRAFFTGDEYVGSLQLQSNVEALKGREKTGIDKEILGNQKFRKALSVGLDRAAYLQVTSVANQPGFGIFNEYHYYDVANGGVYRHETVAKKALLETYGVEYTDANLEEKYASLTGYDLNLARQLMTEAYEEELAAGRISATDKVVLVYGTSTDNAATRLNFDTLSKQFANIAKTTPLEGRFELTFDASFGTKWANDFRDGAYDICAGGWSGAAWDPGYFLLAYLDPGYMYSKAWDTKNEMLTYTPDNVTGEVTMGLLDWYDCLNGQSQTQPYNWAEGMVGNEVRLGIIAAIEKVILSKYYTVPYMYSYSAELVSYKYEYATRNYNTFMGYGGIRYMTYSYNDEQWEGVKGSFDYMK